MKTAISIPDEVFLQAESVAQRLGLSRSELYVRALRTYLAAHEKADVTSALDEVYAQESSHLDPGLAQLQVTSLSEW